MIRCYACRYDRRYFRCISSISPKPCIGFRGQFQRGILLSNMYMQPYSGHIAHDMRNGILHILVFKLIG